MSGRRRLAIATWIVTVGISVVSLILVIATRDAPAPTSWGFRGALEIFGLTCGTVGTIVAIRRPENLIGWLFCAIGLLSAVQAFITAYVVAGVLAIDGGLPWTTALGWLLTWLWVLPIGLAFIYLPLLFPTGALLSRHWRAVAAFGVVAMVAFGVAVSMLPGPIQQATFIDNPLDITGMDFQTYGRTVVGPAAVLLLSAIILALVSLVLRFRRASGDARLQIKWFAFASLFAGLTFVVHTVASLALGSLTATKAIEVLAIFALMGLPIAAGMAILRYRLYDIDRLVSRTIAYAVVTAVLAVAYSAIILLIQQPLGRVTGGDTIAVAVSTLAVAGLFQPVRAFVQRVVDRHFDRARFDAERTTAAFSERLRNEVDLSAVTADLDGTIRGVLAPAGLSVWLRGRDR